LEGVRFIIMLTFVDASLLGPFLAQKIRKAYTSIHQHSEREPTKHLVAFFKNVVRYYYYFNCFKSTLQTLYLEARVQMKW